jgi:hypothetical protein
MESIYQGLDTCDVGGILSSSHPLGIAPDMTRKGHDAVVRPHLNLRRLQPAVGTNAVLYFRSELYILLGTRIHVAGVDAGFCNRILHRGWTCRAWLWLVGNTA